MASTDLLSRSVQRTHEALSEELEALRARFGPPGAHAELEGPHRGYRPIDEFVTTASRHLHAVNEVLLPAARKRLPDGKEVAHDYLDAVKVLEVVLAHVKGHEYGSVYEKGIAWGAVWSEAANALALERHRELDLAGRLTETLDDGEVDALAERLDAVEPGEPSRPHPYLPHRGALGAVARSVVRRSDRAWDHAEGRPSTWPERPPRKPPGLVWQYLLGNPRFDPDESDRSR